jgi:hypothetical protein
MAAMGLEQQLADLRAQFARTAPAGRPAFDEAKIEELRASFAIARALVGAIPPALAVLRRGSWLPLAAWRDGFLFTRLWVLPSCSPSRRVCN